MSIIFMPQLSWSSVSLFLHCQRCFSKEQILKMKRPKVDPDCFALNNAVDTLWKKELDIYREMQEEHPILAANNIQGVPYNDSLIYVWRSYEAGGIRFTDRANGLGLCGIVDDVLIHPSGNLTIIDVKASVKHKWTASLSKSKWSESNKRQMSFYTYLFKMNGYKMHDAAYCIYSNALNDKSCFNQTLDFETTIQEYEIDDSWIDPTLRAIRACLNRGVIPEPATNCELCNFDLKVFHA